MLIMLYIIVSTVSKNNNQNKFESIGRLVLLIILLLIQPWPSSLTVSASVSCLAKWTIDIYILPMLIIDSIIQKFDNMSFWPHPL